MAFMVATSVSMNAGRSNCDRFESTVVIFASSNMTISGQLNDWDYYPWIS